MNRRDLITLLGGAAAAWPLVAEAQQSDWVRRIGVLFPTTADDVNYQAARGVPPGAGKIGLDHRTQRAHRQLATLAENVIAPAEGKAKALEERRRRFEAELTKPQ